jgi:hypothetical protein
MSAHSLTQLARTQVSPVVLPNSLTHCAVGFPYLNRGKLTPGRRVGRTLDHCDAYHITINSLGFLGLV